MKWKLTVRARADLDLEKAQDWYEEQQRGLGKDFRQAIEAALHVIEENPHVCQIYHKKYRQCLPARFRYRIMYFIDGRQVVVVRVFHTSQDFTNLLR